MKLLPFTIAIVLSWSCAQKPASSPIASLPEKQIPAAPTSSQPEPEPPKKEAAQLLTGAQQLNAYLPELAGKQVAMVVNHTSLVGNTHLVDTLLSHKINIRKIFAPEHGFRGEASNGETLKNEIDPNTGLPLVSLYGKNKKPTAEQLADIDLVIFDIQDVGTRFFTYISTMHYVMEACAENAKQVIVLDRPNPNGHYIDGPILKPAFKSFVGMHPIPIVHGLTVGELAQMINGEKWLAGGKSCNLKVIPVKEYTHQTEYILPVKPSPNLPNQQSIRLYPTTCLFEGTMLSVGRGTDYPFQVIGAPDPGFGNFTFTPKDLPYAKNPPHANVKCYGQDFRQDTLNHLSIQLVIDMYKKAPDKTKFFKPYFNTLTGTDQVRKHIESGMTEAQIKQSWQQELQAYKAMRNKYLLYP
ncbi:DUF1343 domain-containing protein [Rhodocytophaga rosea]|uniref:DUF1343 domain-containing protein n=1 Tax=Rhodocytophaga rosea TaxID=2704465 RepID=A0A6C0GTV2_9BACT|nr:DUF1343 domain-containing protein [Rhodocytophaga rosea]QHT71608.1 DUF1343 domain-containing protein [Rhodocytophaga rosea]